MSPLILINDLNSNGVMLLGCALWFFIILLLFVASLL